MLWWMLWVLKRILHLRQAEKEIKKNYRRVLKTQTRMKTEMKEKTCILHAILKHILGVKDHFGTLQQKHDL